MAAGFLGFVVEPNDAAEMRQKFPLAILISRGGAKVAGPFVNAILANDLDPTQPDAKAVKALTKQNKVNETETLALFVGKKKKAARRAIDFATEKGFLVYIAPDGEHATISTESLE